MQFQVLPPGSDSIGIRETSDVNSEFGSVRYRELLKYE